MSRSTPPGPSKWHSLMLGAFPSDDGLVTDAEVLRWQPLWLQREWAEAARARELALPPTERGWATAAEVEELGGNWIEVGDLSSNQRRFIPGWT